MRVFAILITIILVLAWLGFECKDKYRDLARVLFAASALVAALLIGAFFELYGR